MPLKTLLLLLTSIVLGAGGQLSFKAASKALPSFADTGLLKFLLTLFTTPLVLCGFVSFFLSAVMWIIALRSVPLSVAYPMVALSYVIIFAGSAYLFGESIGWKHLAGAVLIVSGILLITSKA